MVTAAINAVGAAVKKAKATPAGVKNAPNLGTPQRTIGQTTAPTTTAPTQDQINALTVIDGILAQYGLSSLSSVVLDYIKQGYDASAINVLIQQTPEWQARFAGNGIRAANGLAPLDPATYLATEASYAQVLAQAGLPAGFYSGGQDYANWIGGNISPAEIQQRANDAGDLVNSQDPGVIAALAEQGIGKDQIAAFFLDSSKALPLIQNTYNAVGVGTAAADQGLHLSGQRAMQFGSMGVTAAQARQAYGQIAQALPGAATLADIYHVAYGQDNLENELLGNSGKDAALRHHLSGLEEANFSGTGGVSVTDSGSSLSGSTAGRF